MIDVISEFRSETCLIQLVRLGNDMLAYDVQISVVHPIYYSWFMWHSEAFHSRQNAESYFHDSVIEYGMNGKSEIVREILEAKGDKVIR